MRDDHEVGCAAADIDRRHAQGARRIGGGFAIGRFRHGALAALRRKQIRDSVLQPQHLAIEIHDLRAARFVVGLDDGGARLGAEQCLVVRAQAVPHELHRRLGPVLEDAPLGQRHARRQGQHYLVEDTNAAGVGTAGPVRDRVDLAKRMLQHLLQHEREQRAAREMRLERLRDSRAQFRGQRAENAAVLGDIRHDRAFDGQSTAALVAAEAHIEAPQLCLRSIVPEVALWARQTGGPLTALGADAQIDGFGARPHHRLPHECVIAAGPVGDLLAAEIGLRELNAALKRLAINAFGAGQIAQFQRIAVVERGMAAVGMPLDQDAAGAAVADIEHKIDLDRRLALMRRHRAGHHEVRHLHRRADDVQQGKIARPVFADAR